MSAGDNSYSVLVPSDKYFRHCLTNGVDRAGMALVRSAFGTGIMFVVVAIFFRKKKESSFRKKMV